MAERLCCEGIYYHVSIEKEGKTEKKRESWWRQHGDDGGHGEERERKSGERKVMIVDVGFLLFFFSLLGFLGCFEKEGDGQQGLSLLNSMTNLWEKVKLKLSKFKSKYLYLYLYLILR